MKVEINAIVLTVSSAAARGEKQDKAGLALVDQLEAAKINIRGRDVIPGDRALIARRLEHYAARSDVNLIFTVGGTGLGPQDITPEATRQMIEREVPGIPELMRMANKNRSPLAIISRAVSGIHANTLIINLPGSVKGVKESVAAIEQILPHAIGTMTQQVPKCGRR